MRGWSSLTAEMVCLLRATAGVDPFAERFLGPASRPLLAAWRRGLPVDGLTFGLQGAIAARHRFIDEALLAALARGAAQVVLLGAGFDARPWRFAAELAGRAVFEVDHPATLAVRVARAAGLPPTGARRVAVDFNRDDFGAALRAAGFEPGRPSFFVWEGVSMYLRRPAVLATLQGVARSGGPGTGIAADFWRRTRRPRWAVAVERAAVAGLGLLGEPLVFGPTAAEVEALFAEAGFTVEASAPMAALGERYGLLRPWPGLRLVEARTASR